VKRQRRWPRETSFGPGSFSRPAWPPRSGQRKIDPPAPEGGSSRGDATYLVYWNRHFQYAGLALERPAENPRSRLRSRGGAPRLHRSRGRSGGRRAVRRRTPASELRREASTTATLAPRKRRAQLPSLAFNRDPPAKGRGLRARARVSGRTTARRYVSSERPHFRVATMSEAMWLPGDAKPPRRTTWSSFPLTQY
jgi:hypothetical protein